MRKYARPFSSREYACCSDIRAPACCKRSHSVSPHRSDALLRTQLLPALCFVSSPIPPLIAQASYAQQRTAYESAYEQITAWQDTQSDTPRASPRQSAAGSVLDGGGSGEALLGAQTLRAPQLAQAGCKSRRHARKSITCKASDASHLARPCPVQLPAIAEPIPPPVATQHLREALAAAAAAPWATPAARFEVATCVMALPASHYTPAARPPLDTPPASSPSAPLPLNGYQWSALGKTAFTVDGIDMSKEKLAELEQRRAAREAAAPVAVA